MRTSVARSWWNALHGRRAGGWFARWSIIGGLLLSAAQTASAFNARISRPIVHEVVALGQTARGTIEIENQEDAPLSLEVYLQDWEYIEGGSGDKVFSVPGSGRWSAASWITYFPEHLDLPARGKGLVEDTIRVPQYGATGGRYAVLFFESVISPGSADE